MKTLVLHDQFGDVDSIAVPGEKLPFGQVQMRPGPNRFVTEIDTTDLPKGKDRADAIQKIRENFRVVSSFGQLVGKRSASTP